MPISRNGGRREANRHPKGTNEDGRRTAIPRERTKMEANRHPNKRAKMGDKRPQCNKRRWKKSGVATKLLFRAYGTSDCGSSVKPAARKRRRPILKSRILSRLSL